mmetsp:Transcript_19171/g.60902  ORF Transcript_19171/g.60902 Transcript_19171/m.60902 type:complete len:215 (+) Transcript_19171:101-745(+)
MCQAVALLRRGHAAHTSARPRRAATTSGVARWRAVLPRLQEGQQSGGLAHEAWQPWAQLEGRATPATWPRARRALLRPGKVPRKRPKSCGPTGGAGRASALRGGVAVDREALLAHPHVHRVLRFVAQYWHRAVLHQGLRNAIGVHVGPEHRGAGRGRDLEAQVVKDGLAATALGQGVEVDEGRGRALAAQPETGILGAAPVHVGPVLLAAVVAH